jgi:hypothetical protein
MGIAADWGLSPESNWEDPDNLLALNGAVTIGTIEQMIEGIRRQDAFPPDMVRNAICDELKITAKQMDRYIHQAHLVMIDRDTRDMDPDDRREFFEGDGDISLLPEDSIIRSVTESLTRIVSTLGYENVDDFMEKAEEIIEQRSDEVDELNRLFYD